MSSHQPAPPPEGGDALDDEQAFALLDRYQQAIDADDGEALAQLRAEHPSQCELFDSLDQLAGLAADSARDTGADGDVTQTLNTAARIANSSIELGGRPLEFGRYLLVEQIGRGGMGAVFRAQQPELNREVAVKIILSGTLATDAELRRFQQEAQSAAGLRHPNIVAIHDVGCAEGMHFFAMDYMTGGSLADRLTQGPLSNLEAAQLVHDIARAVEYLHGRGVIHRDLKPSNIVFDDEGRPCLTDFGLAKAFQDDTGQTRRDQTRTGDVLGTASYMSPEQASGAVRVVSPLSDVYSLGAVLYELLTGAPPFVGESFLDTVLRVIEREPTSPRHVRSDVAKELEQICLRCLKKKPQDRYPSAAALADDLAKYIRGDPVDARANDLSQTARRTTRRYPALVIHLAVLIVVALIVAMRNWLVNGSNPNFVAIECLLAMWAVMSFGLQRYQSNEAWIPWTQMVWAVVDPLFISALIYMAESPREGLLAAYLAFTAASGLWARESLVAAATVTSLLGYGLLLWLQPAMAHPLHHPLIFAALVLSVGLTVGFQVRRLRVLSRYL